MQPCDLPFCLRIDVSPVATQIGPFALYWYGLLVALGFILAIRVATHIAEAQNFDVDQLLSAALVAALFGLLLARVFFVVQNQPGSYLDPKHLGEALSLWQGGLAFDGGIFGGILGAWLYTARYDLPTLRVLDLAGLVAPLGQAVGRLGNLINGDIPGYFTRNWGVEYTNPNNLLLPPGTIFRTQHPVAVYSLVLDLGLFGLLWLGWRRRQLRAGQLAGLYLSGYGVIQLIVQAFRDTPAGPAGLKPSQLTALPIIAAGLWLLLRAVERAPSGQPESKPAP